LAARLKDFSGRIESRKKVSCLSSFVSRPWKGFIFALFPFDSQIALGRRANPGTPGIFDAREGGAEGGLVLGVDEAGEKATGYLSAGLIW
jgi:hypothetical protein